MREIDRYVYLYIYIYMCIGIYVYNTYMYVYTSLLPRPMESGAGSALTSPCDIRC